MNLPYHFPDPREVAYQRAQEFRRLSTSERWEKLAAVIEQGWQLLESSPDRAEMERQMEEQEAEWHRFQRALFRRYLGA